MKIRRDRPWIGVLYLIIDIGMMLAVLYACAKIFEHKLPFSVTLTGLFFDVNNPFRLIFACWLVLVILCNIAHDLYSTKREQIKTVEVWEVTKSVTAASLMMIVLLYASKLTDFPRSLTATITLSAIVFLAGWRFLKRLLVDYLVAHGYNNFNVLIIGAGKVGQALADEIERRPALGLNIVGFLDDYKSEVNGTRRWPVLGKISDFQEIARREFIHKVFITVHHDSRMFLDLLQKAQELHIAVRVVPQGYMLTTGDFQRFQIGVIPILEYCDFAHAHRRLEKRIFDVVLSLLALGVLWPVFVVIAVLIKWDSPGPVFYVSRRYGQRGRVFGMLKFRTMCVHADQLMDQLREKNEVDGPIFKMRNDPRVTRIGRWLRRYSLDELPQLINVLKGDMSLVGPRPLPIDQIEKQDLRQLKRLDVRPGITGLWQIRGRSNLSFKRLLRWDLWYIDNWSFWLDLYILFSTLPVVIKAKGAY